MKMNMKKSEMHHVNGGRDQFTGVRIWHLPRTKPDGLSVRPNGLEREHRPYSNDNDVSIVDIYLINLE